VIVCRACGLAAALALAVSGRTAAQAEVRADLLVANRAVWRGVNRVSGWVAQLQGSGSVRLGPGALGAGVYESRELFEAGEGNATEVGLDRRGLGERNWWAEYRLPAGPLDLAAGATHYTYHGSAALGGRPPAGNTTEIYLLAEAQGTYLSPALAAHWDVDRVRGVYLEASGRLPLLGWPFPPEVFVFLDGALGLSLGEDADAARPADLAYYDGDGLTHAQLGLSVDVKRTRLMAFGGGLRFSAGLDDAARRGADGRERDLFVTVWLGATIGAGLPIK
jgi:hypothetical protein